jgi:hypothetical protein
MTAARRRATASERKRTKLFPLSLVRCQPQVLPNHSLSRSFLLAGEEKWCWLNMVYPPQGVKFKKFHKKIAFSKNHYNSVSICSAP